VSGGSVPSSWTGATWPDRPASGTDQRRSVPPAQGMPLVMGVSASAGSIRSKSCLGSLDPWNRTPVTRESSPDSSPLHCWFRK
jgi:hypothetical protein